MLPPVYRSFVSSGINSRRPWVSVIHTTASEPARSRLESESASTESPRGALACFQSLPYILLIGNRAIPSSSPAGLLSGRDKAHGAFQEGHLCSEWLEASADTRQTGASPQWLFGARDKGRCFGVAVFNPRTFLSEGPMPLRLLVALIVFALCNPAEAQQPKKLPTIGYLASAGSPEDPPLQLEALKQGLQKLGYVVGENVMIVTRYAEGRLDRIPVLVNELVQLKV